MKSKDTKDKEDTKKSKEILIEEDEDFLCCCSIQSKRKEKIISETPEKEPEKEFRFECETLLTHYHEKSWNRIANRFNICWAITSLLLLLVIIVASFVLWFGKILQIST